MKLQNPNVPDWTVEVTDKEAIAEHLAAGWQEMPKRKAVRKSANATKPQVTEQTNTTPLVKAEGDQT